MCRRVQCSNCGRPTFAGCGAHIDQVLANVPFEDRCHCREEKEQDAKPSVEPVQRSWFHKFLEK